MYAMFHFLGSAFSGSSFSPCWAKPEIKGQKEVENFFYYLGLLFLGWMLSS